MQSVELPVILVRFITQKSDSFSNPRKVMSKVLQTGEVSPKFNAQKRYRNGCLNPKRKNVLKQNLVIRNHFKKKINNPFTTRTELRNLNTTSMFKAHDLSINGTYWMNLISPRAGSHTLRHKQRRSCGRWAGERSSKTFTWEITKLDGVGWGA